MINHLENPLESLEAKIEELDTYITSLKENMVPKCLFIMQSDYQNRIKKLRKEGYR